jgi:hypothetical protein
MLPETRIRSSNLEINFVLQKPKDNYRFFMFRWSCILV